MVLALALGACVPSPTKPGLPPPGGTGWNQYPYTLNDNPLFTFPFIEGRTTNGTDTWYIQSKVTGANTGREYAFITIFAKNRINGTVRADVYNFSVFPLDSTEYGSFTATDIELDTPLNPGKLTAAEGYLDLRWQDGGTWKTRVDSENRLIPFEYELDLSGADSEGQPMGLVATMVAHEAPAAPGPGPTPGIITINGQGGTGTYFQTGLEISGTLTYDGVTEPVHGTIGHIDRQWFPQYAGAYMGTYARDHGHDWGSVHLDDNSTLSLWRQYFRPLGNEVEDFSGATRFFPGTESTEFAPDLTVTPTSFVKWPGSVNTAFAPPAPNRYLMSAHVIDVPSWDLHLAGSPITIAPAHGLPVEYMSGPVNYAGTIAGQPINGFGMSERTMALYRKWELVDVLDVTLANLPDGAFGGVTRAAMQTMVGQLDAAVGIGDDATGNQILTTQLAPAVTTLAIGEQPFLSELLQDIANAPVV
ncbi:MAG TPA: hypothetical protein VJM33_11025 [Microthrixaceae bacterium]|nr:hypothetical protein [Microthrixaceae bacterium]